MMKITDSISPNDMGILAILHLDYEQEELDTMLKSHRDDTRGYKFDILYKWSKKNSADKKVIKIPSVLFQMGSYLFIRNNYHLISLNRFKMD